MHAWHRQGTPELRGEYRLTDFYERGRQRELRFRHMADSAPVIVWVTEADGTCSYLNARWYEFTGQTPETALGFGWLDATHPADREAVERAFFTSNRACAPFRIEYRLRRPDGTWAWAIDSAAPRSTVPDTISATSAR